MRALYPQSNTVLNVLCCHAPSFCLLLFFFFHRAKRCTRKTRRRGGIRSRSTSVGFSTSFGEHLDTKANFRRPDLHPLLAYHSAAVTALEQSNGYYVAISGRQDFKAGTSDAHISKHAVDRLVEFIVLGPSVRFVPFCRSLAEPPPASEYPKVRAFALAPGLVQTRLLVEAGAKDLPPLDTVALPAATTLYLTSGRADWLSGRYRFVFTLYALPYTFQGTTPQIGTL